MRTIHVYFMLHTELMLHEARRLKVHQRANGTEFVLMRNRRHRYVRVTLDTPTEVFITKEKL